MVWKMIKWTGILLAAALFAVLLARILKLYAGWRG
jgi:hypothetical protein